MRPLTCLLAALPALCLGQLPPATPVHLMILRPLASGSSRVGDVIPMVVTKDVSAGGKTYLAEGDMVFARITQSRGEGALSATVLDRPARLALRFEHARDADGRSVTLWPTPGHGGELQIVREMTVNPSKEEAREYELAWENPQSRSVLDKIHKLFSDQAVSLTRGEAEVLIRHNVRLPFVQQAIKDNLFDSVSGFIQDLKRGRGLEAMLSLTTATKPAALCLRAVRELGHLSGGVGSYVGGRFKGRNIQCPAGVELTAYVGA